MAKFYAKPALAYMHLFVCSQLTDYNRWPTSLLLYVLCMILLETVTLLSTRHPCAPPPALILSWLLLSLQDVVPVYILCHGVLSPLAPILLDQVLSL